MTVKSNYMIVIALLSGWLSNSVPVLQPAPSKPQSFLVKCNFSHALNKLRVTAMNFDWLIPLFAPVMTGRSNYFGFSFLAGI
mgnify:CR=1 FL=1